MKNMKCYYWQGFLHKLMNHEGAVKDFQRTMNNAIYNIAHE